MIEHRLRETLFNKSERVYRLDGDRLSIIEPSGSRREVALAAITRIALGANPGRYNSFRHLTRLSVADGPAVTISNSHFLGLARFEDRSGSYRVLIEALLASLAEARPDLPVRIGSSPLAYWSQLVLIGLLFLALAYVLIAFTPEGGPSAWQWLKITIIIGMLPVFVLWIRVRRPRRATVASVPPAALPAAPVDSQL